MAIPIAILDCDLLLHGRGHKTLDRFDLESVSDNFLLSQFGFPREFILYLIELLQEALCRRTQRSRAISPEVQVLAALGFYTSGSFQTSMGTTIGISQASMSRCVSDVTRALVTIKAPTIEDLSYVNKKGFHSVGCQLVCNAQGLLLSAETNWPGGLKDTDILQSSNLSKQMQYTEEGWLLGDHRYPLRKWMMTPVDSPESSAELQYNLAHAATCEIVDRTFRAIQSRFKCLDGSKGYLQYSPERSSAILLACCVLHNAFLQSGFDAWAVERVAPVEQPDSTEERTEVNDSQAEEIRRSLILKHFS
ncbi:putative nuclease HARBI1 [Takifugu flavidus]|uniref:Putative nuclease HARBI1 n=1 Tax=Takifugu flavidus TaxID=433684 RepID=A0A5C6NAZ1_9TELE|nr:putative nuclease HARBI1 [Takifugu flavidus]